MVLQEFQLRVDRRFPQHVVAAGERLADLFDEVLTQVVSRPSLCQVYMSRLFRGASVFFCNGIFIAIVFP